ncbi:hypothetical protein IE53DRAFT_359939 [Violaceomyces palustris]|uniref:Uncharacterized protein n=1 Tax=Violaceomyces palustris TaxID=1673888 RepID=A0ACD0P5U5_9BASI|nr:hypothetical protein IE53DRAFT_359939 [Violaceomyces palustris]
MPSSSLDHSSVKRHRRSNTPVNSFTKTFIYPTGSLRETHASAASTGAPAAAPAGMVAADDGIPSYISARSANSLISEHRPTRIQAETLLVLNRLLDELLLMILSSAKSLATDRIKTDGMLKVMNNNLLAKNAVLEAELELRSYVDGKRAEGAKVPLGLMATSRLDGTDNFPVASAYNALRVRCQFYSTLGDREDESAGADQNIMTSDGRPIATITPGVAIYVTALLEFVGEYILQNIARVIERDNSDEASLHDLRAAITEDEALVGLYSRMAISREVQTRIEMGIARRSRRGNGMAGEDAGARVVKPWHVPSDVHEFDEAAGPTRFSRRASVQPGPRVSSNPSSFQHERRSSAGHGTISSDRMRDSLTGGGTASPITTSAGTSSVMSHSTPMTAGSVSDQGTNPTWRSSQEKGWGNQLFGGAKRRNSLRQSSDASSAGGYGKMLSPAEANRRDDLILDSEDDFEALVASGQTMKVSLTPNRLRTIEVAKEEAEAKKNAARRRPGTLVSPLREEPTIRSPVPSPVGTINSRLSMQQAESIYENGSTDNLSRANVVRRPSSRNSGHQYASRMAKVQSPPPSSYRSPSNGGGSQNGHSMDGQSIAHASSSTDPEPTEVERQASSSARNRLQPREEGFSPKSVTRDMVDLLNSTPVFLSDSGTFPSNENGGGQGNSLGLSNAPGDASKKLGVGGRVRNLFGRKGSSVKEAQNPLRQSMSTVRSDRQQGVEVKDSWATDEGHDRGIHTNPSSATSSSSVAAAKHRGSISNSFDSEKRRSGFGGNPNDVAGLGIVKTTLRAGSEASADSFGAPPPAINTPKSLRVTPTQAHTPERHQNEDDDLPSIVETTSSPPNESAATAASASASASASSALDADAYSRSKTPPSPPPKQRPDLPHSRKVPWGYNRQSSASGHSKFDETRSGTPTSEKRRSLGYTNSPLQTTPGSAGLVRGYSSAGGASFDQSAGGGASGSLQSHEHNIRGTATPTLTPAQSLGGSRAVSRSPLQAKGKSLLFETLGPAYDARLRSKSSAAVLATLIELERRMRSCTSVEECRMVVATALASERDRGLNGDGALDVADDEYDANFKPATGGKKDGSSSASGRPSTDSRTEDADLKPVILCSPSPGPRLVMAESGISSSPKENHGVVAGWLLGGDSEPTVEVSAHVDDPKGMDAVRVSDLSTALGKARDAMPPPSTLPVSSSPQARSGFPYVNSGARSSAQHLAQAESLSGNLNGSGKLSTSTSSSTETNPRFHDSNSGITQKSWNTNLKRASNSAVSISTAYSSYNDAKEGPETEDERISS